MDLEVRELLRNNNPPTEDTLQALRGLLAGHRCNLAQADKEIDRLDELLKIARKTLEDAEETTRNYKTILSPIRRIPTNVLHQIFYHCLATHRNPIMSSSEAPILLTHVCSTWRSIALSFPRLWSRIRINFAYSNPVPELEIGGRLVSLEEALHMRCNAIKDWLDRSGSFLLSISIYHSGTDGWSWEDRHLPPGDASTLELFKSITSLSHRWEEIELLMRPEVYCKLETMVSPDNIYALKTVRIGLDYHLDDYGPRMMISSASPAFDETYPGSLLLKAPNLQIIALNQSTERLWIPTLPSWTRLLYFSCHNSPVSLTDTLAFLKKCYRLIHVKLRVLPSDSPEMLQPEDKIILQNLQSISIIGKASERDTVAALLSHIDTPELDRISYQYPGKNLPRDEDKTSLAPFPWLSVLKTSKIRSLTLDPRVLSDGLDELISILRLSTGVTHLVIGQESEVELASREDFSMNHYPLASFDYPCLFHLLTVDHEATSEKEVFLPNLEFFDASVGSTVSQETLINFITGRMNPSSSRGTAVLKSVRMALDTLPCDNEYWALQSNVYMFAESVGIEIHADFQYFSHRERDSPFLSASYGLGQVNDRSWFYQDGDANQ